MENRPFLQTLSGQTLRTPPLWLMRQAGRYLSEYRAVRATTPDFICFCLDPKKAAEVTLQPIQRFGFDAAIVFADILLVPMMFGQEVRFEAGEGPVLGPLPDLERAKTIDLKAAVGPLSAVGETLSIVKPALPLQTTLIGFAGAPWTVLTYMLSPQAFPTKVETGFAPGNAQTYGKRDHDFAVRLSYAEPEVVDQWLDLLVEATAHYLAMQVAAGADVLQIFDSWAEGLSEPLFQKLVIRPHQNLIARLRSMDITTPIIGFPRAAGGHYETYARDVDVAAIGLDTSVPITFGQRIQALKPIQGNLDPLLLRAGGKALDERVEALKAGWGGNPYIFNLGHGILPDTPIEHVEQLIKRVRS